MSGTHDAADARGADGRRRWCAEARVLAAADDTARAQAPRLGLSDTAWIGRLPDWVHAAPHARAELALLTGAVLCASTLRRTVDGRVLQPLAARIGADRLAALTALRIPAALPRDWDWDWHTGADRGDDPVAALGALGCEVLIRVGALPPALAHRLARLLDATDVLADADPVALQRVVDIAGMLARHGDGRLGEAA